MHTLQHACSAEQVLVASLLTDSLGHLHYSIAVD